MTTTYFGRNTGAGILPDSALLEMVANRALVQPSSIELPVSDQYAIIPASQTPWKTDTVRTMLRSAGVRIQQIPDEGLLIAPGTIAIVRCELNVVPDDMPLLERALKLPPGTRAIASPKSSIGRLDIFCRVISDGEPCYDTISPAADMRREIWIEIAPLSFPIVVTRGDKLTQLRIQSEASLAPIASKRMTLGLETDRGKPVGYRALHCHDPIRLSAQPGTIDPARYFEPLAGNRLVMNPGEFFILQTAETLTVPMTECAQAASTDDNIGNFLSHLAGFADPNFGVDHPSRLVLEVRARDVPILAEHGMPIVRIDHFAMTKAPDQGYGAAIGSNYQGQGLKLSKYFA
jgi:dCTP deaminase